MPPAMVRRRRGRARSARGGGWVVRPEVPLGQSRRAPHAAVLVATFVICGLTATARAEDERPGVFTYAYQGLVVGVEPDWQRATWSPAKAACIPRTGSP